MLHTIPQFQTEIITEVQSFRGVLFPAEIGFGQLLVTGPPGSGKSTLIEKIGGWPEEGFVDLSVKRWWTSRMLSLRPREVHLGLPFVGFTEGMAIFDREWVEASGELHLDIARIVVPPAAKKFILFRNWRNKYVFEFLLPSAEWVYEQRMIRARRKSHRVDEDFDLKLVERQLDTLWNAARYLYHHGFLLYIREGVDGNLIRFTGSRE